MNRENDPNPFQGKNRVPAILITLFLSSFAVALFYIIYRQFSGGWERLGVVGPWRDTFAHTLDLDTKPILWDVYSIGTAKVEWEWGGFKVSEPFWMCACHFWLRSRHSAFNFNLRVSFPVISVNAFSALNDSHYPPPRFIPCPPRRGCHSIGRDSQKRRERQCT